MKHTNKKGFTIVELVIVIAVIAILAAVLIPTFSNLIKKANQSADIQATRQMNTVLAAGQGLGDNIDDVIDVLVQNGYSANGLTPVTADHKFYYVAAFERIALVDTKKNEVVFPAEIKYEDIENGTKFDLSECGKYIDVAADNYDAFKAAINLGSEDVVLSSNFELAEELTIPAGANVLLNLNSFEFTAAKAGARSKYLNTSGTLTIANGVLNARGVQAYNGGKIVVNEGTTINSVDSNGGGAFWVYAGGSVEINGGSFNTESGNGDLVNVNDPDGADPTLMNNSGTVVINGGAFSSKKSFAYAIINTDGRMTINGGTFTADRGVIAANGGTIEINGGTFATNEGASAHVVYASNGHIVVNAGTFTGTYAIDGTGSITFKAGVVLNGETLAADLVVGTPVTE